MTAELEKIAASIAEPDTYADPTRVERAFKILRSCSPVHWVKANGIKPFWAVTRHPDVIAVEQNGQTFLAAPRTVLFNELAETAFSQLTGRSPPLQPLTHMDDPAHRAYRVITQACFTPDRIRRLEASISTMARQSIDELMDADMEVDFAAVTAKFPLRVLMNILGTPADDLPLLLELNRNLLGVDDPQRRTKRDPFEAIRTALVEYRDYFDDLTGERRARPRNDIATLIARAKIDGKPIPDFERLSYFIILATAGHDTTSFAISGGLHALIKHPQQLEKLKNDLSLLDRGVDEILRWTSPVRHFMRTAKQESDVGGTKIRAGESLALFFISANRDERVFIDSEKFLINRYPNPQVAFGQGAHFCLGHHLAKVEIRVFLKELMSRLDRIEFAGTPQWARSNFVGGIRSLPIRCRLRPARAK